LFTSLFGSGIILLGYIKAANVSSVSTCAGPS